MSKKIKNKNRGFSLLEIMVVVVILGILGAVVAPNVMGSKQKAEVQKAQTDIANFEKALELYSLDNVSYPSSLTELSPNYIKKLPADPWRNDYKLEVQGTSFTISSAGPDKQFGNEDDITNK